MAGVKRGSVRVLMVFCIALASLAAVAPEEVAAQPGQPNIVLINLDDADVDLLDEWAIDAYFPNIKALLQDSGTRFTNLHSVDPLCGPSRAALFRGQYAHNTGVERNAHGWEIFYDRGYTDSEIGMWMREAGYHTALVGKYCHQGYPDAAHNISYVPPGWDEFHASLGGKYFGYVRSINGVRSVAAPYPDQYRTDSERDSVNSIIAAHDTSGPLFLYVAPFAPHAAVDVPGRMVAPRHLGEFSQAEVPRTPDFNEVDTTDKSPQFAGLAALNAGQVAQVDKHYRERIQAMLAVDELVGDLFAELDARAMTSNTVVVLTSDNGFQLGQHRDLFKKDHFDRVTRVQAIVRGPGVPAGESQNHLLAHIDLIPTILDLAAAPKPHFLDGKSFAPLLTNGGAFDEETWRSSVLVENRDGKSVFGVPLNLDYKMLRRYSDVYVEWANGQREFYDLAVDPDQLDNAYPLLSVAERAELSAELAALKSCAGQHCHGGASIDPIDTMLDLNPGTQFPSSVVSFGGTASDDQAVAGVKLVVRQVATGLYWSGLGFGDGYVAFDAALSSPGSPTSDWSTELTLPAGEYWLSARAIDHGGDVDPEAATAFFSTPADVVDPVSVIDVPVAGVVVDPFVVSGSASDDVGVDRVLVVVLDKTTGLFFNGVGYQSAYTRVAAVLADPGAQTTTWSYTVAGAASGRHYLSARAWDVSGNVQNAPDSVVVTVGGAADVVDPVSVIDVPVAGVVVDPFVVSGSASDDVGVDRVLVVVLDKTTGLFFNGVGYQSAYTRVAAVLADPGAQTTTWSYTVAGAASGRHYTASRAFDTSNNAQKPPAKVYVTVQ